MLPISFHRRLAALALAAAFLPACASSPNRPDLTASEISGLQATGLDFRTAPLGQVAALRGKVTLVHFFATWCFPCLAETPSLNLLSQELGSQGLEVVAFGMDLEGAAVLLPFADLNGLTFPVLIPGEDLRAGQSPFGRIQALPSTFLFARDGRLAAFWEGPAEPARLKALVERLLSEEP